MDRISSSGGLTPTNDHTSEIKKSTLDETTEKVALSRLSSSSEEPVIQVSSEEIQAPKVETPRGDFHLKMDKSRLKLLQGGLKRIGLSTLGALVRIPMSLSLMVISPFMRLAAAFALPFSEDISKQLYSQSILYTAMGVSGPLTSVLEVIGSVLSTVVDPIVGKPVIRNAQLWAESAVLFPALLAGVKMQASREDNKTLKNLFQNISNITNLVDNTKLRFAQGNQVKIGDLERTEVYKLAPKNSPANDYLRAVTKAKTLMSKFEQFLNVSKIKKAVKDL